MASGNSWQLYRELYTVDGGGWDRRKSQFYSLRKSLGLRRESLTSPAGLSGLIGQLVDDRRDSGQIHRSMSLRQDKTAVVDPIVRQSSPSPTVATTGATTDSLRRQTSDVTSVERWSTATSSVDQFATATDLSDVATSNEDDEDDDLDEYLELEPLTSNTPPLLLSSSINVGKGGGGGGGCDDDEDDWIASIRHRRRPTFFVPDPHCPIHGQLLNRTPAVAVSGATSGQTSGQRPATATAVGQERTPELSRWQRRKMASAAPAGVFIQDSPLSWKILRRRRKARMSVSDRHRVNGEKSKIQRNLFTLSVAFLFLISAFQGLQNLQTSINGQQGLGALSLSAVYLGLVVSCLFTPPYLLNRIGCKSTLLLSAFTYTLYMLTQFMPKWYSLIPGSLLVGFAAAPLWAAKCSYLVESGIRYAELTLIPPNVVIVRFFGIFFMIVHLGQVFGNTISTWILSAAGRPRHVPILDQVDASCGHFYASLRNLTESAALNLARPADSAVYSLYGVYFCCTLVAILILALFLNQLPQDVHINLEKPYFKLDVWNTTVQHLLKPRHLLLIPLTIFNGMEQAFMAAEFTKAYVGCCWGVTQIGHVLSIFGISDAICSLVFGPLIMLFGRMPLFMFGAVVDMLMIFTLLVWPPNPADTGIFYVVAACWGMADGVWNTQINGLWVYLFSDNLEAAFANYRLWESVGFMIAFAYTPFLSTETKLYILLAMLYVGMIGYGMIELWQPLETYIERLKSTPKVELVKVLRSSNRLRQSERITNDGNDEEREALTRYAKKYANTPLVVAEEIT